MELLPAGYAEFREKNYWNRFFSLLKDDTFEWYGNYESIKRILYEAVRNRLTYVNNDDAEKNRGNRENPGDDEKEEKEEKKEISFNESLNFNERGFCKGSFKKERKRNEKVLKQNDKAEKLNKNCLLINVGCGNSKINIDLYEDGFCDIVNLDYSEVVITNMRERYGDKMKFIQVDISNKNEFHKIMEELEKEKEKKKRDYKIIFDKAFLDAFLSTESNEDIQPSINNAQTYFSTIFQYLSWGDIFIIITLAQPQILVKIMANIAVQKNVQVDVYLIELKKNARKYKHQPFAFVISRNSQKNIQECSNIIFFNKNEKIVKPVNMSKILTEVKEIQLKVPYRIFQKGQRVLLDVVHTEINKCKHNIIVYDSHVEKETYKTAVIIVPPGYEFSFFYATPKGNEQLAKLAKAKRLLLVMKSNFVEENEKVKKNDEEENEKRKENGEEKIDTDEMDEFDKINESNELYENKKAVKELLEETKHSLNNILKDLMYGQSEQFPIMLLNEEIKQCKTICRKKSPYANDIIVRDILVTDEFLNDHIKNDEEKLHHNNNKKSEEKKKKKNGKKYKEINCDKINYDEVQFNEIYTLLKTKKEKREEYFRTKDIFYRQLIFSCDPLTVQSEVVYTIPKKKKKENSKEELIPEQLQFEYAESASQYHIFFCCAFFFLIQENFPIDQEIKICILGGGTNVLSNIIKTVFVSFSLSFDIVELDEVVHHLSYMFSKESSDIDNQKTNYFVEDAYQYIKNYDKTKGLYDFIFLDINNSENSFLMDSKDEEKLYIVCPHINFIRVDVLCDVKRMLKEKGILAINLLTRDEKSRKYVYKFLKQEFTSVLSMSGDSQDENNEVLICRSEVFTPKAINEFVNNMKKLILKNQISWFLNFDFNKCINNLNII